MHTIARTALALTFFTIAATGTATSASAAEGESEVVYAGTVSVTDIQPDGTPYPRTDTYERSVTLVCAAGRCTIDDFWFIAHERQELVLVDGEASLDLPETGNSCSDGDTRAEQIVIAAGERFVATVTFPVQALAQCDASNSSQRWGSIYTWDLDLVSGDPCSIDDSCPEPTPTAIAVPAPISGSEGRGPEDPSVLSALPTVAAAFTPGNVAWAAIGTVVLVLLVAFPTQLFNRSADIVTERLAARWSERRGGRAPRGLTLTGLPAAAIGVAAAAVLSAFVDPAFGVNPASARMLGSIAVGFVIDVAVGWVVVIALVRRVRPGAAARFEFRPLTLLIVVAAVLFTRLTGFEPGIVFGLVAGVVFGGLLAGSDRARVTLTTLGYGFAAALFAWAVYSGLSLVPNPTPVLVFVQETLASVAIAGIAALPIVLLPVRGLAGHDVWTWNRLVWGASYAVGLAGFLFVLLPMPFSWQSITASIWAWGALYLAYALTAVGIWLAVEKPWARPSTSELERASATSSSDTTR
jgi:hypothetical protein